MEKTPYIGALNTKVKIYRMDTTRDAVGSTVETPVLLCETYAALTDNSGNEIVNEAIMHVQRSVYVIRKRAGLLANEKLQLHDDGVVYNIEHVKKLGRRYLQINCTAHE